MAECHQCGAQDLSPDVLGLNRKLVCLVASRKAIEIALRNNEIRLRRTTLCDYLRGTQPVAQGE